MRPGERRAAIERELAITGKVSVDALAKALLVSPISIRRDLNSLVESGVAKRVHGGAVAAGPVAASPDRAVPVRRAAVGSAARQATIGLVVPASRYYYAGVLEGVKAAATELRARVVLAVSGYSTEEEQAQIARLIERGVDGLVVTPSVVAEEDPGTYRMLHDLPVPVVLMERDGGDEFTALDSVRSDHAFGARAAFRQLAAGGHRAVALVSAEATATAGWLRRGFDATRDLFDGERSERMSIPSLPEYSPELRGRLAEVLERCLERGITGALVHPDVAAGVLATLARSRGVAIPDEFEVIAYDDEVAELADPPLDAIAPRKHEVGRTALGLAIERTLAPSPSEFVPRHITVPPVYVSRAESVVAGH